MNPQSGSGGNCGYYGPDGIPNFGADRWNPTAAFGRELGERPAFGIGDAIVASGKPAGHIQISPQVKKVAVPVGIGAAVLAGAVFGLKMAFIPSAAVAGGVAAIAAFAFNTKASA
jgi:hypothetical protein